MTRFVHGLCAALILAFVSGVHEPLTAADGITPVTVQAVDAWVHAVHTHVPGTPDESVAAVRRMTYQNRVDMNTGIEMFFVVLRGGPADAHGNRAAEQLIAIAKGAGMPDAATFFKHAAVLHTDAVIFAGRFPQPIDRTLPPPTETERRSAGATGFSRVRTPETTRVPPLLTHVALVRYTDGDVVGTTYADWNWPFARSLFDELIALQRLPIDVSPVAHDPFVGQWYHAVASYLFGTRMYGDATDHFFHATEVLPNDPRLLFDRGCYAELFGLPEHQVFVSDSNSGPLHPKVPVREATNRDAERLFRRALEIDPSFVEARVHLARVLDVRGSRAEAAVELKTVLASKPGGVVGFYARLFAARVAQERDALDEAAAQYREALALFPHAQSALLGSSQVALAAGDASSAAKMLEGLGPESAKGDADPWWDYALASGRDVDELVHHMWAAVSR